MARHATPRHAEWRHAEWCASAPLRVVRLNALAAQLHAEFLFDGGRYLSRGRSARGHQWWKRLTVLGEGCLQNWQRAGAMFLEVSEHLDRQEPLTSSLPEI